jgi:CrcB protein
MNVIYLVVGGSLGTLARHYGAMRLANVTGSPAAAILAVNVSGAFTIGLFLSLAEHRFNWPPGVVLGVGVGFLGAYTTFSTLTWHTLQYTEAGEMAAAALNVAASVVLGMAAVWAGAQLGRAAG